MLIVSITSTMEGFTIEKQSWAGFNSLTISLYF